MKIFNEFILKNHKLKNKIVMPPCVCFGWSDDSGLVSDAHIDHYKKRAIGEVGLIIVEAAAIEKEGRLADSQIGIWNDSQFESLSNLSKAINEEGSVSLIQIHHAGNKSRENISKEPLSASKLKLDDGRYSKEMTIKDIKNIQEKFINSALMAERAGFNGIELHAAHGYLINQFISPITNKRTDEYGGNIENRMRFITEMVDQIKSKVSKNFILSARLGANSSTLEDGIKAAKILEKHGLDMIHISAGISDEEDIPSPPKNFNYNWIIFMGVEIKKHLTIPVIVVNGLRSIEQANYLIENKMADFTAIGRGLLVDPNWAKKSRKNEKVLPCLNCKPCKWFSDGRNCPQYE